MFFTNGKLQSYEQLMRQSPRHHPVHKKKKPPTLPSKPLPTMTQKEEKSDGNQ